MIVEKQTDLPDLSSEETLCLDIESTSFNDAEDGLHPFNGHRVAGYGISTLDGRSWYVPIRHRSPGAKNIPYEVAQNWLKDIAKRSRKWIGHNIKFDARFSYQDGMYLQGDLTDTMVLARLVNPLRFNASLKVLAKEYCDIDQQKDDARVREYLNASGSHDYGTVPIDILGEYCQKDLLATTSLYTKLMKHLPAECSQLWDIERAATRTLLNSELRGINVPRRPLLIYAATTLQQFLAKQMELEELCGEVVDVNSNKELTRVMTEKLCVSPREWTSSGAPSWSAEGLRQYGIKAADLIADAKELSYQHSSFGDGWLRRLAPDETLHPNFKQYGTKTGRLSCEDPNYQNLNSSAKKQVTPRPGFTLVSIDASQIEFRLFAHYTNAPKIVARYNEDPNTDYHQSMADMIGIPRKPAKSINFGFIYGMGRAKLEGIITEFIRTAARTNDVKILTALAKFNYGEAVNEKNAGIVASNIYNYVHRIIPEIRQFGYKVEKLVRERGFVRNIYRRYYYVPVELAHKARNFVVQGAAADLLKDWLASIPPVLDKHGAFLLANVHDELLLECPTENVDHFVEDIVPVLEHPHVDLRVPVRVEVSICPDGGSWADKVGYIEWKESKK